MQLLSCQACQWFWFARSESERGRCSLKLKKEKWSGCCDGGKASQTAAAAAGEILFCIMKAAAGAACVCVVCEYRVAF